MQELPEFPGASLAHRTFGSMPETILPVAASATMTAERNESNFGAEQFPRGQDTDRQVGTRCGNSPKHAAVPRFPDGSRTVPTMLVLNFHQWLPYPGKVSSQSGKVLIAALILVFRCL